MAEASKKNPKYTVYVVCGSMKLDLTPVVEEINFSEQKNQIAKRAQISLVNRQVNGKWLTGTLNVRDRVTVYADDGERNEEVWRGFIWTIGYKSGLSGHNLTLKCYDHLIYFQESEDAEYFPSGKSSKDIMSALCSKWGIKLEYSYESITHAKMPLRGTLSDIFISDILDPVRERTGKKYVILSDKDTMIVRHVGQNKTVYEIKKAVNGTGTSSEVTMDGMTTKVVILGKADKDDRQPAEATVTGDTAKYGTLQKVISRASNTELADAKTEAQTIINNNGKPKRSYAVTTVDIPWIRKGDYVKVQAGNVVGTYLVVGVERDISNKGKLMTLSLEDK